MIQLHKNKGHRIEFQITRQYLYRWCEIIKDFCTPNWSMPAKHKYWSQISILVLSSQKAGLSRQKGALYKIIACVISVIHFGSMKMQLLNSIVYRVPQFSYQSGIEENWPDLLESVAISSPGFHALVKDLNPSDPNFKKDPLYHTIWKYFNRARFRATPYGTFASVGTCDFGPSSTPFVLADNAIQHNLPDWTEQAGIDHNFQTLISTDGKLFANSSYYLHGNSIRYIGREKESYELFEVDKEDLTLAILQATCKLIRASELLNDPGIASAGKETLIAQIERMLADQLVISELSPNSIGQDYFHRIGKAENTTQNYYLSVRTSLSGSLDPKPFRHLSELAERLQQLLPSYFSPDLVQFKSDFLKKYGEAEVPIMQALDPECGIGYGKLDEDGLTSPLMESLNSNRTKEHDDDNQTLKLLLPFLVGTHQQIIRLEDIPVPSPPRSNEPLPNTLPVLATVTDDLLQLDHIGGATANSLIGRFTHATEDIHAMSKNLAAIEMSANQDVCFFDIDYLVGSAAAINNVNRRRQIYPLQLSLLTYDTSSAPLDLRDILVSVRDEQVILRSVSLDKRLIPRFASAYNYMLSSLPIFRMLCDLQHQGIHKNLYLRLRDRLPSLNYYPRIQFRNIIVSPQTWKLMFSDVSMATSGKETETLKAVLKEKKVTKFVKVGSTDQTLSIDTNNEDDLQQLYQMLKKNGTLYLEEILIPAKAAMLDSTGAPYLSQVLVSLFHNERIYTGIGGDKRLPREDGDRIKAIAPGGDWLYYKIFCYPIRANILLSEIFASIIQQHQQRIKKWFFIRYTEGGDHLRIRIEVKDAKTATDISTDFNRAMQKHLNAGLVKDVSLHTYEPELARYGEEHMEAMEQHFCRDSRYVLKAIGYHLSELELYSLSLSVLQQISSSGLFSNDDWDNLILSYCDKFTREHQLKPEAFKMLNKTFKKLDTSISAGTISQLQAATDGFVASFVETLSRYSGEERPKLFGDMWHMHVNRLFPSRQRSHELAIYYFMQKLQKQRKHILL